MRHAEQNNATLTNWKLPLLIGLVTTLGLGLIFLIVTPRTIEQAMAQGRYDIALSLLTEKAEAGDAEAQNLLGTLFYIGLDVPRNHKLASKWFLASALQGNAKAQVNIARQYQYGYGVKIDSLRAYGWLRQARINGNEVAENYMKWQASSMILVPNQMQRAIELYGTLEGLIPSEERGGL